MRLDCLRTAFVIGGSLALAGGLAAGEGGGDELRPFADAQNPAPQDQSPIAAVVPCDDPGHCPPIHSAWILTGTAELLVLLPNLQGLQAPDVRVLAGLDGALMAYASAVQSQTPPLQANRDAKGWTVFRSDGTVFPDGTRISFMGSGRFGEMKVLAQTSPGARLADAFIDKRADAIVLAAPIGAALGRTGALGVWFDGSIWWAYNEDGSKLPAGERVLFLDGGHRGGRATHEAGNDFGGIGVVLDDARLNGNPSAVVLAQHAFRASLNPSPLATWYDAGQARWIVYNADGSPFPLGEAVHYMVGP